VHLAWQTTKEKNTKSEGNGLGIGSGIPIAIAEWPQRSEYVNAVAHKTFEIAINKQPSDRRHFRIPAEAIPIPFPADRMRH